MSGMRTAIIMKPTSPRASRHAGRTVFNGDLSEPGPISEEAIDAAVGLMRDGRLFRYGEDRGGVPEAALLEEEFAAYMGLKYAVGVNSGGCAIFIALKSAGVEQGDRVLMNAFTLAPVPGAISHAGGETVLVDISDDYTVDLDDLDRKARETGAKFFLLSYMRGHVPDMEAVLQVCRRHDLTVIEDCAHTLGARWEGRLSGTFGTVSCFSSQTFKHVNSGEGGLLATDDPDIAARAILLSGSYMLYAQHRARPPLAVFDRHKYLMPNCSMRMSNLAAAVLRPQIKLIDERAVAWRTIYDRVATGFQSIECIRMPVRIDQNSCVPTSIQFSLVDLDVDQITQFLNSVSARGVHVKWFGRPEPEGFTFTHRHWRYIHADTVPENTDRVLAGLCDMRLPLSLRPEDCDTVVQVVREAMEDVLERSRCA